MLISPAHIGALGARPSTGGGGGPVQPSISISPTDPPAFSALPATWSPTVTIVGLSQVKWAVFQVSLSGQFTSSMTWQTVSVSGSFSPNASMTQERDRLIVKSLDDTVEAVSGPAALNAPLPSDTGGLTMARNFVSDLTLGLNIERGGIIWAGRMTSAQFQDYKNTGITHVRFFPPIGGIFGNNFPNVSAGELDWLFEAAERAMGVGLKVLVDLLDVCSVQALTDAGVMPYLAAAAQRIAGRNWDVNRYALGAVNEYEGGTNVQHRAKMHEATATLRARLPNSLLLCASANWGSPDTLTDGTFVPPPDSRILVQWHSYDWNGDDIAGPSWRQEQVSTWAAQNNLVTINGEYGPWEPSFCPDPARFAPTIDAAARGMGQQRPTFWTVTDQGCLRYNQGSGTSSAALLSDVAAAISAGNTHIRSQSWFTGTSTGSGGSPNPGNTVTRLQVLHRGQSNAVFAIQYGGDWMLRDTLANLTQLPVDMISRVNTSDDNTVHSGTSSFFDNGQNNYDSRWLEASGNYTTNPPLWGNKSPMTQTLNAVSRYVSSDTAIPLFDLQVHWEYDLAMWDGAAQTAYRAGHWEITRRIRAARPKAAGKHIAFYGYCPYEGGSWASLGVINDAWVADLGDATRNVVMACGNMMDGQKNTQYVAEGDPSHWGDQSAPRIYPRVAFRMAKYAWDQGWCPSNVDLSDCPTMGPRILSAVRSGSGNSINVTVAHDKGTSLVAGIDGIDWAAFTMSDGAGNSHVDATGGAITGTSSIRVDFPASPPVGGRIWHAYFPVFRRKLVMRDNWHSIKPAKYATAPNVGVVEFPLQRTMTGVSYS